MCPAYAYENRIAICINNECQIYAVDATGRQAGTHHIASARYEDLHSSAAPADVYEAPDGQWTPRMTTYVLAPDYTTFSGYIATLPPWEADLLQHVQLMLDPAYICLDLQIYFYAGTDGSVLFETDGAFEWSLSNTEGERVATAMGPARGADMDLYRAECTGMLSFLRFLVCIAMYANVDDSWWGLVGTDSQSLLNALYAETEAGEDGRKQLAVLDVLDAEWDLLVEIQEALRELPGVDLTYIKGHQDDRVPYDRLPLMAQLNVDADRLAAKYQNLHGAPR